MKLYLRAGLSLAVWDHTVLPATGVLSRHIFRGKLSPNFEKLPPPPRSFGQVYSSIKNPVIGMIAFAVIKN